MTLPDYFVVDYNHSNTVIYYYRCAGDKYACMEYNIMKDYSLGAWIGGFMEEQWNIENEWEYWKEKDTVSIYDKILPGEMVQVAQDMLEKLIFAPK